MRALLAVFVAVCVIGAGTGLVSAYTKPWEPLVVSTKADRSGARGLLGATVKGDVFVFVRHNKAHKATFYLDGQLLRTEESTPLDLAGTAPNGVAFPFDTRTLVDGRHKVTVVLTLRSKRLRLVQSVGFNVRNSVSSPSTATTTTTAPPTTTTTTSTPSSTTTTTVVSPIQKPDAANTGPRTAITRTLTSAQALSELRSTGRLSNVRITGGLSFSGSDGRNWIIEDSRIEGGVYTVRGYQSLVPFTGTAAERPVMRYVEIVGAGALGAGSSSANVYGSDMVIEYADIYGGIDGIKAVNNLSILRSWIHDLDRPAGAHNDGIQIREGTGSLFKGTRIDAYVGYSSDNSGGLGDWGSGGLQTGSVTGPIQATFEDNWFAGGRYTMRGAESGDEATVDYTFRNNRWMQYGTSVALARTDLPANQYGPVAGDFDVFTSNLWEHTNQSVR